MTIHKSLVYDYRGDHYKWHKGCWRGSGEGNLTHAQLCGYIESGEAWPIIESGEGAGTESITSVPFGHSTGGIWEAVEYFHYIGSNGRENVGAVCKRLDAVTWFWTVYIFPGTGGASKIVIGQGEGRDRDVCLDHAHSCWKTECERRIS